MLDEDGVFAVVRQGRPEVKLRQVALEVADRWDGTGQCWRVSISPAVGPSVQRVEHQALAGGAVEAEECRSQKRINGAVDGRAVDREEGGAGDIQQAEE